MRRRLDVVRSLRSPWEVVVDLLGHDPGSVLGSPGGKPRRFHSEIVADLGAGSSMHQTVAVELGPFERWAEGARAELLWEPAGRQRVLPSFVGTVSVEAGSDSSQLRVTGGYRPPLGPLGAVGDAVAGRHVARRSLVTFTEQLARRIDTEVDRRTSRDVRPAPYADDLRPRVFEGG